MLDREQVCETWPVAALDAVPARLIQAGTAGRVPLGQIVCLAKIAYARADVPERRRDEIGSERGIRQLVHNLNRNQGLRPLNP